MSRVWRLVACLDDGGRRPIVRQANMGTETLRNTLVYKHQEDILCKELNKYMNK